MTPGLPGVAACGRIISYVRYVVVISKIAPNIWWIRRKTVDSAPFAGPYNRSLPRA